MATVLPAAKLGGGNFVHIFLHPTGNMQYVRIAGITRVLYSVARVENRDAMTPSQAHQLDAKMDDGRINTGDVVGRDNGAFGSMINYTVDPAGADSASSGCQYPTDYYNVQNSNQLCQIDVRPSF